ncbi:hypothetical protein V5O48_013142, partial [Marasmius crinis-equi]
MSQVPNSKPSFTPEQEAYVNQFFNHWSQRKEQELAAQISTKFDSSVEAQVKSYLKKVGLNISNEQAGPSQPTQAGSSQPTQPDPSSAPQRAPFISPIPVIRSDIDMEDNTPPPSPTDSFRSTSSAVTSTATATVKPNQNAVPPSTGRPAHAESPTPQSASAPGSATPDPTHSSSSSQAPAPSASTKNPIQFMTDLLDGMSPPKRNSKPKPKPTEPRKEPSPADMFRIVSGDLTPAQSKLEDAMFLWVRFMWSMVQKEDTPTLPTEEELSIFKSHINSLEQLRARSNMSGSLIPPSMVSLDNRAVFHSNRKGARHAKNAARLDQRFLQQTTTHMSRFGIVR